MSLWFLWEWREQTPKQTLGVRTDPKKELLVRCLDKAQKDFDQNMHDTRSAPAPNLSQIAVKTFETDKKICHDIYN